MIERLGSDYKVMKGAVNRSEPNLHERALHPAPRMSFTLGSLHSPFVLSIRAGLGPSSLGRCAAYGERKDRARISETGTNLITFHSSARFLASYIPCLGSFPRLSRSFSSRLCCHRSLSTFGHSGLLPFGRSPSRRANETRE